MPADLTPAPRRVTVQRIAALCAHYARMLRLAGWRFVCAVVPGLKDPRTGDHAWALVDPDPGTKTATVRVRDIDATPIPKFDGDAMLEIRVTVAHELLHCVVAEAVGATGGVLTIPAEERIVETAAQAIVRSEGLDARVMARAVRALPSALRARVAASAGQRARGGAAMDPETIQKMIDALKAGDGESALKMCEEALVKAASGGAAPHAEPDGDEVAKVEAAPAPGGTDGGGYPAPADDARRAKGAEMDQDKARARKAADEAEKAAAEIKAMADAARPAAKEGLVVGLRARLGSALTPAAEKRIMSSPDFGAAKLVADIIEETVVAAGGGNTERARSNVEHEANPGQGSGPKLLTPEALLAEGHSPSWIKGYQNTAKIGAEHAAAYLEQGRIGLRARTGKTQNGAAS
ncbi:MAG: hypothetical protein ACM3O6_10005 [Acidobacteriota bacterium]